MTDRAEGSSDIRANRRFLTGVFLLALVPRLILALLTRDLPIGLDDMFQYDMLARSIVQGNGYRWYAEDDLHLIKRFLPMEVPDDYEPIGIETSFRGPGYPLFLAGTYAVVGTGEDRLFGARIIQSFSGALLAPLTYLLALRLGLKEKSARLSAIIIALIPLLIAYTLALASENSFIILLTLFFILCLEFRNKDSKLGWLITGVVLGLTALTRSVVTGFVPLVLLWGFLWGWERCFRIRNMIFFVLGFALVTIPWMARNSSLHNQLTWIETSLGYNMYMGYHPESSGRFQFGISLDLLPIMDDAERNQVGMQAFQDFVRDDPTRVPSLIMNKAGYFFGMDKRALMYFYSNGVLGSLSAPYLGLVFLLAVLPFVLLALGTAVGIAFSPMTRSRGFIILCSIYFLAVHALILGDARFHVPLFPIFAIFASFAYIESPWRGAKRWQYILALILILLLIFNWGLEITRDLETLVALFGPDGHQLGLSY